jgi:hypothetical protein
MDVVCLLFATAYTFFCLALEAIREFEPYREPVLLCFAFVLLVYLFRGYPPQVMFARCYSSGIVHLHLRHGQNTDLDAMSMQRSSFWELSKKSVYIIRKVCVIFRKVATTRQMRYLCMVSVVRLPCHALVASQRSAPPLGVYGIVRLPCAFLFCRLEVTKRV